MDPRPRYLYRLTYPFRTLGMGLAALPIAVVLHDLQAGWPAWAWLGISCVLWPHLAWWLARRSADPYRAEARNFLLDSVFVGSLLPVIHFNLLPTAVLVTVVTADKVNSGIPGLWLRALPAMLAATLVVGLFTGFAVDLPSRTAVVLACLPIMAIHTLAVSANLYRLIRRVQVQNLQLEDMARRDPLTGLDNRRHWEQRAHRLLARCQREGTPASLLLIDLDRFKPINDRLGHGAGDDVLRGLAQLLERELPEGHVSGRLGGDEFVAVLPLPADQAVVHAESLHAGVRALEWPDLPGLSVSVSIGLAPAPATGGLREWLESADHALYRAKGAGRDRTGRPVAESTAP